MAHARRSPGLADRWVHFEEVEGDVVTEEQAQEMLQLLSDIKTQLDTLPTALATLTEFSHWMFACLGFLCGAIVVQTFFVGKGNS